jgi:hypothetical protein
MASSRDPEPRTLGGGSIRVRRRRCIVTENTEIQDKRRLIYNELEKDRHKNSTSKSFSFHHHYS